MAYFLPRSNRLYAALVQIRPLYRYGVTLLFITILGYGWFVGIYARIDHIIDSYKKDLIAYDKQQAASASMARECKRLKQSIDALENSLHQHVSMPQLGVDGLQVGLALVFDLAEYCGLTLDSCILNGSKKECDWYTQHSVTLDVMGTFDQVLYFFDTLATQKTVIGCETVMIKRMHDGINAQCCLLFTTFS